MIKRSKRPLKNGHIAAFEDNLLSSNNKGFGTTQHCQVEKRAFTLAGVLIILGIIGVVASLTLLILLTGTGKPNKLSNDKCAFEVGSTCYTAVFTPKPLTKPECEAEKGKLGIKECNSDTDYWAGAVKQCGGVSKMPTADDLAKLASQLYKGNPSIGAEQGYDGQWNRGAAKSLGFTSSGSWIWSGKERNSRYAYNRYFGPAFSIWGSSCRHLTNFQAVCIGE